MLIERMCSICLNVFQTNNPNQITCSKECRDIKTGKIKLKENCIVCNKLFIPTHGRKIKVCSEKCRKKYKTTNNFYSIDRKCLWCNKTYQTDKYNPVKYCSDHCCKLGRSSAAKRHFELKRIESSEIKVPEIITERSKDLRLKFGDKIISTWLTSGFSQKLKDAILERDNYMCFICHKETNLHIHHIIPRVMGGPHIPENLVTLCGGCHRSVESGDVVLAVRNCVKRALSNSKFS